MLTAAHEADSLYTFWPLLTGLAGTAQRHESRVGTQSTALPALPSLWCHHRMTVLSWSHFRLGQEADSNYGGTVSHTRWEVNSVSGEEALGGGGGPFHFSVTLWPTQPTWRAVFLVCLEQLVNFSYKKRHLLNQFEMGFHGDSRNKVVAIFSMAGCTLWTSEVLYLYAPRHWHALWWGAGVSWISVFLPTRAPRTHIFRGRCPCFLSVRIQETNIWKLRNQRSEECVGRASWVEYTCIWTDKLPETGKQLRKFRADSVGATVCFMCCGKDGSVCLVVLILYVYGVCVLCAQASLCARACMWGSETDIWTLCHPSPCHWGRVPSLLQGSAVSAFQAPSSGITGGFATTTWPSCLCSKCVILVASPCLSLPLPNTSCSRQLRMHKLLRNLEFLKKEEENHENYCWVPLCWGFHSRTGQPAFLLGLYSMYLWVHLPFCWLFI